MQKEENTKAKNNTSKLQEKQRQREKAKDHKDNKCDKYSSNNLNTQLGPGRNRNISQNN